MRDEIASLIAPPEESRTVSGAFVDEVATGGTLFGNALSMAAGRAALLDVLTEEAFERTAALGERMAAGTEDGDRQRGSPLGAWRSTALTLLLLLGRAAHRRGRLARRRPPRPACADPGVHGEPGRRESGWWLGPTVSVAHADEDVDRYVETFEAFLANVT
jgi:glutamate-1-semialdehyde 2,1-aminomutase